MGNLASKIPIPGSKTATTTTTTTPVTNMERLPSNPNMLVPSFESSSANAYSKVGQRLPGQGAAVAQTNANGPVRAIDVLPELRNIPALDSRATTSYVQPTRTGTYFTERPKENNLPNLDLSPSNPLPSGGAFASSVGRSGALQVSGALQTSGALHNSGALQTSGVLQNSGTFQTPGGANRLKIFGGEAKLRNQVDEYGVLPFENRMDQSRRASHAEIPGSSVFPVVPLPTSSYEPLSLHISDRGMKGTALDNSGPYSAISNMQPGAYTTMSGVRTEHVRTHETFEQAYPELQGIRQPPQAPQDFYDQRIDLNYKLLDDANPASRAAAIISQSGLVSQIPMAQSVGLFPNNQSGVVTTTTTTETYNIAPANSAFQNPSQNLDNLGPILSNFSQGQNLPSNFSGINPGQVTSTTYSSVNPNFNAVPMNLGSQFGALPTESGLGLVTTTAEQALAGPKGPLRIFDSKPSNPQNFIF